MASTLGVMLQLVAALGLAACGAQPSGVAAIRVDPAQRHQIMTGWEAVAQAGQDEPDFLQFRDTLFHLAVESLGINRVRIQVRSGSEHRRDYWLERRAGLLSGSAYSCARWETQNDNADPQVIDWAGFQFTELDESIERVVLPMRQHLAARGERLVVNLLYVSFMNQCPAGATWDHANLDEYAEFVTATFLHLDQKYGLVPDLFEVILEPDNTNRWDGAMVGRAIVAVTDRLRRSGFTPGIVAPSNTNMSRALSWFDQAITVPGALPSIRELSYHRYSGVSDATLQAIGERARRHGIATAMLEHMGSGIEDLHADLTVGQVSAWEQFALAWPAPQDDGGTYYRITRTGGHPVIREGERTRYLRQYFRPVRLGAQRIGASSDDGRLEPVAFRNPDGGIVVVIRAHGSSDITVAGLPGGTYAVTWAVESGSGASPDVSIAAGEILRTRIGGAGALTIARR